MQNIAEAMRGLSLASAVLDVLLIAQLAAAGLSESRRWFTRFLAYDVLATTLLVFAMHTRQYTLILLCARPIYWLLLFAVLLEIYSLFLSGYPRLWRMMRWAVIAAAAVSVGATLAYSAGLRRPATLAGMCLTLQAANRTVVYLLAVAMALMWLFKSRLRIDLPRHIWMHAILFSAFAGVEAGYGLARDVLHFGVWTAAVSRLVLADFCLAGWIVSAARVTRSLPARLCSRVGSQCGPRVANPLGPPDSQSAS